MNYFFINNYYYVSYNTFEVVGGKNGVRGLYRREIKSNEPVKLSQVVVRVDMIRGVPDGGQEVPLGEFVVVHEGAEVVVGAGVGGPQPVKGRDVAGVVRIINT